MRFGEAIREIIAKRGYSIRSFGVEVGVQGSSVGRTLTHDNAPMSKVLAYTNALGYDVAFVPKGCKLPDGSYIVTGEGEDND